MDPLYLTSLSSLDFFFGYHAISSWDARPKKQHVISGIPELFWGEQETKTTGRQLGYSHL